MNVLGITLLAIFKWLFVAGMMMYTVFAVVVVMQVKVMTETFESDVNLVVKVLALAHLVMAILITAAALVIL